MKNNKDIKIAQIACAWPPYAGGIGNSAYQIGQILSNHYQVENFHPDNLRPWLRFGHGAFAPCLLYRLASFDYIYLHYPFFGSSELVWLFKKFHKKNKLIIHFHMDVELSSPWLKLAALPSRLIKKSLFKQADWIICSSFDYLASSSLSKIYQKYPDKFQEIPFGLNTEVFKPADLNSPSNNPLADKAKKIIKFVNDNFINRHHCQIIFVGGLDRAHYFKGVDKLIEAVSQLKNDNWTLSIIGDGDLRLYYQQMTDNLHLSHKIKFLGKLSGPELIRSLQRGDLLVLPSINKNEAFGLVLIEAMACGLPIIASNLPGVRSVFEDDQEGLLVEPGNVEDLCAKIEIMIGDYKKREMMGKLARQKALAKYSQNNFERAILDLFKDDKV